MPELSTLSDSRRVAKQNTSNLLTWHSPNQTLPGGDREVYPGFRHHKAGGKPGPKIRMDGAGDWKFPGTFRPPTNSSKFIAKSAQSTHLLHEIFLEMLLQEGSRRLRIMSLHASCQYQLDTLSFPPSRPSFNDGGTSSAKQNEILCENSLKRNNSNSRTIPPTQTHPCHIFFSCFFCRINPPNIPVTCAPSFPI